MDMDIASESKLMRDLEAYRILHQKNKKFLKLPLDVPPVEWYTGGS